MDWDFGAVLKNQKIPLLKMILDKYRLNLLSIPREKASVGDLYVQEGNSPYVSTPGSISNFLEPAFEIPQLTNGEIMAFVSGTTSRDASGKAGMDFLEGFINALGPAVVGSKFKQPMNQVARIRSLSLSKTLRATILILVYWEEN